MKKKLISVVVPVFNEQENIPVFYAEFIKVTKSADFDFEIIFVNDGSNDNSIKELKKLHNKDSRIKVLNFSRNFGSYSAIEAGFKYSQGDAVMAISVDLQDPPSLVNDFVKKWRDGSDIVWGVRAGRKDPFFKKIFAAIFYKLIRKFVFGGEFPIDGMDTGLFDRKIINLYLECRDRNSIPFFTIYEMGFNQIRIPYVRMNRTIGESGWPFWKRIKCALDIFVGFSYFPIRLFTAVGIISALIAFLYAFILIVLKLFFGFGSAGWTSLAALILFIGGIQMIFLGIVAEYIWRISDKVKNKPVYYVMEEIGIKNK